MPKETVEKKKGQNVLKNKRHELFCQLYVGLSARTYFNNATRCYLYAYGGEERINDIEETLSVVVGKRGLVLEGELEELPVLPKRLDIVEGKTSWRAVESALKADKKSTYNVANSEGTKLLVKPSIFERCNYLLDRFLDEDFAEREMAWVIAQRFDIRSKVSAFEAISKAKGRLNDKIPSKVSFSWEEEEEPTKPPKKTKTKQGAKKTVKKTKTVSVSFEGDDEEK